MKQAKHLGATFFFIVALSTICMPKILLASHAERAGKITMIVGAATMGLAALAFMTPALIIHADTAALVETQCTVLSNSLGTHRCCRLNTLGCTRCNYGDPSCSALMVALREGSCCDGYKCCTYSTQCRTCLNCDRSHNCTPYDCQCVSVCIRSVSDQSGQVSCSNCYDPSALLQYPAVFQGISSNRTTTISKSCGQDIACATSYTTTWGVGSQHTCYYDQNDPNENIHLTKDFTTADALQWTAVTVGGAGALCLVIGGALFALSKRT